MNYNHISGVGTPRLANYFQNHIPCHQNRAKNQQFYRDLIDKTGDFCRFFLDFHRKSQLNRLQLRLFN